MLLTEILVYNIAFSIILGSHRCTIESLAMCEDSTIYKETKEKLLVVNMEMHQLKPLANHTSSNLNRHFRTSNAGSNPGYPRGFNIKLKRRNAMEDLQGMEDITVDASGIAKEEVHN